MNAGFGALSPQVIQSMQSASALLQRGQFAQARALLEQVVQSHPRFVEAHRLLGGALQAMGENPAAERALRTAIGIDPRWAPAQLALAEMLASAERFGEAETAFRAALNAGDRSPRVVFGLAQLLNRTGRASEAVELLAPLAAGPSAQAAILTEYANALTLLGDRADDALRAYERAVQAAPDLGIAEYNLASALENSGRHAAAQESAQRARRKGFDAPQTWFVSASAALAQNDFDRAETDFREALRRDPNYVDAHRELSQLIWMRDADTDAATAAIDAAIARSTQPEPLLRVKSMLLASAEKAADAFATIRDAADRADANAETLLVAADVGIGVDATAAVGYARRAMAIVPKEATIQRALGSALIAAGFAQEADAFASLILHERPNDQHMLAIQATAWRLLGDSRYGELYDYARFVRPWTLDVPAGWADLKSYVDALAASLRKLHALRTHPIGQSLRHGTQTTQNLLQSDDPVIRSIPQALDGPLREHIEALGSGDDPLRKRIASGYRIKGIWSVQLRPNGFHTNHTHPEGWLSSACYLDVPDSVATGHEGWLKLGEPGIPTHPPLPAEHFVKPSPGLLALFPSYMWHGTVPFSGDKPRLTFAFDVVPV